MLRRFTYGSSPKLRSSNHICKTSSSTIRCFFSSFKNSSGTSTSSSKASSSGNNSNEPSTTTTAFESVMLKSSSTSTKIPLSISYGCAGIIGRRHSMEDAHFNIVDYYNNRESNQSTDEQPKGKNVINTFGILDGHAGASVANRAAELLPEKIFSSENNKKELLSSPEQTGKIMINAVLDVDDILYREKHSSGACLVFSVVHSGENERKIVVGSLGDCAAFVCEGLNTAIPLSTEHKPNAPKEEARIKRCGGFVKYQMTYRPGRYDVVIHRLCGRLSLSRALGDFAWKVSGGGASGSIQRLFGSSSNNSSNELPRNQELMMSNVVDIYSIDISDATKYMVLGCDGLFDVLHEKDIISFLNQFFVHYSKELKAHPEKTLNSAAQALIQQAFHEGSGDNISATIVLFHDPKEQTYGK